MHTRSTRTCQLPFDLRRDDLASREFRWMRDQRGQMLLDPPGDFPGGFVGPGPILEDGDRGDDIPARVQGVIRHEAGELAQDGDETLIDLPRDVIDGTPVQARVSPDDSIRLISRPVDLLRLRGALLRGPELRFEL